MISNMKYCVFFSALLWLLPALVSAKDEGRGVPGFVRLLSSVSVGGGKLSVSIDGEPVREEGYQPGDVTGGIPVYAGVHRIQFKRDGVKPGETSVTVKAGETTILIPFAELVPAAGDEPAHWKIRILRLKQHDPETQRTATIVSVSARPEVALEVRQSRGKWETLHVKRLGFQRTEIRQARGYLPVRHDGSILSEISVGKSGNHVLVLYDDEKGELRATSFRDYKYLSAD
jgi:hypothetical protein